MYVENEVMEEIREKKAQSAIDRSLQFLKEVKQEVERVTWPNKDEVKGATVVVIIVVILIGFFIGLVDKILTIMNDVILF
ncbi:MAG: preprotein translocase subunit SecE [Candidatus Glassbacteria bacterium]